VEELEDGLLRRAAGLVDSARHVTLLAGHCSGAPEVRLARMCWSRVASAMREDEPGRSEQRAKRRVRPLFIDTTKPGEGVRKAAPTALPERSRWALSAGSGKGLADRPSV
jgi:hypothetical protein